MAISVLILTKDEEANLPGCLDSLAWCDDVVVLDSLSADRTVEIARARGARVVERAFDDYARQRNFGLRDIPYAHAWVLMLDADERVPAALGTEMLAAVRGAPQPVCLFRMRRRDHLFGRWIRSSGYPSWFGRLARVGRVWVERPINEQYHTDGETASLEEHLDHYPFNKGFSAWVAKHDRYSSMEAGVLADERAAPLPALSGLLARDPGRRRSTLKAVVYRLPARPLVIFFALYVLKGGILEGRAGFTFSVLRSWYEFMIDCKAREIRRRRERQPI